MQDGQSRQRLGGSRVGHVVDRTPDPGWPSVQDVRVDLRRGDVSVPEQLLNGTDVVPVFEQMRREGMTERVGSGSLRDAAECGGNFADDLDESPLPESGSSDPIPRRSRTSRESRCDHSFASWR